jgi:hypothetical protein|nr:MAG TPA: hypothetical protein [Caudoviricetes sp.]
MDDVTASIIIACQTAGAVNSINKLGFALGMLGRKAIEFGAESIRIFSDLQEETQKFETVFAGVQNEANKHVQELIDKYGQSELSARRMMAQAGDLMRSTGINQNYVNMISGWVSKLGSDLTSFSNYAEGAERATFNLVKASLGEPEAAKALGVFIKTDTKEFKALEKQAKSTGLYIERFGATLKASNDIQARQFAALYQMFDQKGYVLGDYWRNQESIANQSRKLANRIDELKTTIGGFINSVIQVGNIKGEFADTFASITGYIKENSAEWSYYVASFINIMRGGFELIWTVVKNAFSNVAVVGKYVWESLVQAWSDAPGFFGAVWEDIKNIAGNTWNLIMVDVTGTFDFFSTVLDSFLRNWKGIFGDMWKIVINSLKSIGVAFWESIKNIGKIAASLGENFWDLITGEKSFSEAVGGVFDTYLQASYETQQKIAKQWEGFEFGAGTKRFASDVGDAFYEYQKKRLGAAKKLIGEAGKNTERYLAQNGIRMGEFTSITEGIDGVIDAYGRRQREIDSRRGLTAGDDVAARNKGGDDQFVASMKSIADDIKSFRDRSQTEILANSVEALRLQSRVFTQSPEIRIQERQLDVLEKIRRGIDKMSSPTRTNPLVSYGGN